MGAALDSSDRLVLVHRARAAADELIEGVLRVPVAKALDLRTPRGFDRAVALLAARLQARAQATEEGALRAAVGELDVDWHATTAAERRTLIERAMVAAGRRTARVPEEIRATLGAVGKEVVQAARDDVRRGQGLSIAANFNAMDRRIVQHLEASEANCVRDEYGRRRDDFSEKARRIVADGLEAGLGRDDISEQLAVAARELLVQRSDFYWDIVASAFIGRGRSYGQLSSYAEAGIERYRIEAVLDEATTACCRFLHGKTFTVKRGIERFEEAEREPDRLKEISPWVREAVDEGTGRRVLYVNRGDQRIVLAEVVRSGEGQRDDLGEFRHARSEEELSAASIGVPPYHGRCRTVTLAVI